MDKQILSGMSPVHISKVLNRIVETVTCLECCKLYNSPQSEACGHPLCRGCWVGRQVCAVCSRRVSRRSQKANACLASYTKRVQSMTSAFEKLFRTKLEELTELPVPVSVLNDANKNVKVWLADSENQFSAPISTQQSTQGDSFAVEVKTCEIQVHTDTKKPDIPAKVVVAPALTQDDWDKIETIPDTEDITRNKENVGPINQELFSFNDEQYTTDHPRRSSRKRQIKDDPTTRAKIVDKHSSKDNIPSNISVDTERLNKIKHNWSNVKKMRKEFSKLKKNDKLNVSIEMCKKKQNVNSKPTTAPVEVVESQQAVTIDDCTPNITEKVLTPADKMVVVKKTSHVNENQISDKAKSHDTDDGSSSKHMKRVITPENIVLSVNANEKVEENVPFIQKSALRRQSVINESKNSNVSKPVNHTINCNDENPDSDIQITIKTGKTITNILITKKNDVQVKLNSDQEVQTTQKIDKSISCTTSDNKACEVENIAISIGDKHVVSSVTQEINDNVTKSNKKVSSEKTVSTKKNTASAETVPFEITASVEKELSKVMEFDSEVSNLVQDKRLVKNTQIDQKNDAEVTSASNMAGRKGRDEKAIEFDEDIFASGSVQEGNVKLLKDSQTAPSEILMPTLRQARTQTQKQADKRDRERNDDDTPKKKKRKIAKEIKTNQSVYEIENALKSQNNDGGNQSDSVNYDSVMEQVFANIDADMDNVDKSQSIIKDRSKVQDDIPTAVSEQSQKFTTQKTRKKALGLSTLANATQNVASKFQQKDSENLFTQSIRESQLEQQKPGAEIEAHIDNLLTPGIYKELASTSALPEEGVLIEATPGIDGDDSDLSVYEETPQKTSYTKKWSEQSSSNKVESGKNTQKSPAKDPTVTEGVINISDSENTTDVTVCENKHKASLETPNTRKFYDNIHHNSTPVARKSLNSTPVARKSLNFVSQQNEDSKSMSVFPKNTQEREIIDKAFEPSQKSFAKPLAVFPVQKFCVAASCLTQAEVKVLEALCKMKKWEFVREYTPELTHLVVAVDKDGKCQRTVKFMCAIASGKWIVKYDWVTDCIKQGTKVPEWLYEALDYTGDPGPKRARTADKKLFEGFIFFCKPPFTVLNEKVLKTMLESAGGTVVSDASQVRVTGDSVKLLLAEPENTQENQFTYLALKLNIVPVNYEWALNCLGTYTLSSILELLLCPASLLPEETHRWPDAVVRQDDDSSD